MLSMSCHNLKLSQYAVKLLQPLINNSHIVKDGYHFIKDINQVIMKPSYIMASFDVESLFTNIPVQDNTDIATLMTFPDKNVLIYQGFTKKRFIKLLQSCTKNSYFTFNDKLYYQRRDGYGQSSWSHFCRHFFRIL